MLFTIDQQQVPSLAVCVGIEVTQGNNALTKTMGGKNKDKLSVTKPAYEREG